MSDKKKNRAQLDEKGKIKELEKKVQENLAGWQKALADYQNLHKDTEKRIGQLKDFTKSDLVRDILPIFDNYQLALEHLPTDTKQESWAVGLEHTIKLWHSFLQEHDIKQIKTIGAKFDTHLHESVGQVKDKVKKDQIIIEEKQSGYMLKDMVIRPAKVIINNH